MNLKPRMQWALAVLAVPAFFVASWLLNCFLLWAER